MSENKILSLLKKGKKLFDKKKALEALDVFNNVLKISPGNYDALNFKVQLLKKLGRPKELIPVSFQFNLLKLQKDGTIPSNYESPDSWIIDAIKLINKGQDDRALIYLAQAAYISPIVNSDGLDSMTFHANAKIYFFTAFIYFRKQENYQYAKALIEIAKKLDTRLVIPEKIENIYNNYVSNRSGKGVSLIAPLNTSNLISLFPNRDKILVSTEAIAEVKVQTPTTKRKYDTKIKTYTWKTHLILSDYALAFFGAAPICKEPAYYVPWAFISYISGGNSLAVSNEINALKYSIPMELISNPHDVSQGGIPWQYLDKIDVHSLIEMNKNEMIERIMNNLKSLEQLPSYKNYKKQFEVIPKEIYKRTVQFIKNSRK